MQGCLVVGHPAKSAVSGSRWLPANMSLETLDVKETHIDKWYDMVFWETKKPALIGPHAI